MEKHLKKIIRRWRKIEKYERMELRVWGYSGIAFLILSLVSHILIVNAIYTFIIFVEVCKRIERLRIERYYNLLRERLYIARIQFLEDACENHTKTFNIIIDDLNEKSVKDEGFVKSMLKEERSVGASVSVFSSPSEVNFSPTEEK